MADRKYFAHQVSIRHDKEHICGGSIINEYYILTASHCVFYSDGSLLDVNRVTVVSGDLSLDNPDSNTHVSHVTDIYSHPEYNARLIQNDITLIKVILISYYYYYYYKYSYF